MPSKIRWTHGLATAALVSFAWVGLGAGQDAAQSIEEGVRLIEAGDLDKAVVLLDAVAQQLRTQPEARARLALAQLHLGANYLGLEQQAKARTAFLDAYLADPAVVPDVASFAPRVVEVYAEVRAAAIGASLGPREGPTGGGSEQPSKGKGKSKPLLIGGLLAGGGGVAVALGAGTGGTGAGPTGASSNPGATAAVTPTPRPSATPIPTPTPTAAESQRFTCQPDGAIKEVYLNEITAGRTGFFRASVSFDQAGRGAVRVAIANRYGGGAEHAVNQADGGAVELESPSLTAGLYILKVQSFAPVNRLCQATWQLHFR